MLSRVAIGKVCVGLASCASFCALQVFKSEYAHILSHWGVVPKGHPADLSLAYALPTEDSHTRTAPAWRLLNACSALTVSLRAQNVWHDALQRVLPRDLN